MFEKQSTSWQCRNGSIKGLIRHGSDGTLCHYPSRVCSVASTSSWGTSTQDNSHEGGNLVANDAIRKVALGVHCFSVEGPRSAGQEKIARRIKIIVKN